ncbi:MAG: helix-turn-helix domain-containing protein [Clostridia bacterium]|nr:helix-turn-helix domain-containing protein [Clostridia bacterium]
MKILNFGSCNIDYVYSLDHIVQAGETETTSAMSVFAGGKGLNQSIALARAGVRVCHAGCMGEGGDFLRELLDANGVDTSFLQTVAEKNGHAIIQVSREGENSIFLYPGSNECVTREQIDQTLSHFSQGDLLVLQNEISEPEYLVTAAHRKGMQIVLNPSPCNERILALDLKKLTYLILNEIEAKAISSKASAEEALQFFKTQYPKLKVMLTLGKKGCIYSDAAQTVRHPIFRVPAVDTTAAGDTFTGYFVAGLARREPIGAILRTASCASAITVSRMGAAPSIPTLEEVLGSDLIAEPLSSPVRSERLLAMLEEYLTVYLTSANLSELAGLWGYTEVYAGQMVRRLTGTTFGALLRERRVVAAAKLLLETDLPVGEIIRGVGYENESFFRTAFRKKYQMNPLEYRKNLRGETKC